jgi:hypothetical protein
MIKAKLSCLILAMVVDSLKYSQLLFVAAMQPCDGRKLRHSLVLQLRRRLSHSRSCPRSRCGLTVCTSPSNSLLCVVPLRTVSSVMSDKTPRPCYSTRLATAKFRAHILIRDRCSLLPRVAKGNTKMRYGNGFFRRILSFFNLQFSDLLAVR